MDDTKPQVRAGCYCRISSDPKDRRAGVDRQREDTAVMCEVNGWTPTHTYVDNDRSATNGKARPEWDRLMADVTAGKIDAIVVWNQDRGWRKMSDLEELRPVLAAHNVKLATTNIGVIDFNNPDDVFRTHVSTALSEMEVAKLKVRVRRAARQKAERGEPQWRNAFGYRTDGSRQPDPVTAPLVKRVYGDVLAGGSISDAARMLNAETAFGLSGKPWTAGTLSLFLRKPRNAGLRSHNGVIVGPGTWPALVDEPTWRATQAVLNAPGRAPGRKTVRRHLLTGVLRCGNDSCNSTMVGSWVMQPTGGTSGRPKKGETKPPRQTAHRITYVCKTCRGCSVAAHHVEPLIYRVVSGRLAMPDAVDLLKAEIHDQAEAEQIRAELTRLYGELDAIGVERGEGLLTGQQAKTATDIVTAKIAKLEASQQDAERLRVFDGLPLGTPEVIEAVNDLSPDRFRAVLSVLYTITVLPVGKGGKVFNPERIIFGDPATGEVLR